MNYISDLNYLGHKNEFVSLYVAAYVAAVTNCQPCFYAKGQYYKGVDMGGGAREVNSPPDFLENIII